MILDACSSYTALSALDQGGLRFWTICGRVLIRMMTVCKRSPHTCLFISSKGGQQRCQRSDWQRPSYSFLSVQANATPLFPWCLDVLISRALLPRESNSDQGGRYLISVSITWAAHSSWVSMHKDQEPCRSWAIDFSREEGLERTGGQSPWPGGQRERRGRREKLYLPTSQAGVGSIGDWLGAQNWKWWDFLPCLPQLCSWWAYFILCFACIFPHLNQHLRET